MASVLEGPKVKLPSMLNGPGEKPGANVPPCISSPPPHCPVPASTPPESVPVAPAGRLKVAKVPEFPMRVRPVNWLNAPLAANVPEDTSSVP
jgi:hypothetical protein